MENDYSRGYRDLRLYRLVAGWKFPRTYSGKIMLVAFVGTHIPLIALCTFFALATSFTTSERLEVVGVALIATLCGMAATLWILDKLLKPITITSKGLREYLTQGVVPSLPSGIAGQAGMLMEDTSCIIGQLDDSVSRIKGCALAGKRARNEFLAVMSHELRTPMNGILGYAELLSQTPSLPSDCRENLKNLTSSAEMLLHVLDGVLHYTRIQSGQVQMALRPFPPAKLLSDVVRFFSQTAAERKLTLSSHVDPALPALLSGDTDFLDQILLNLVGNALKFTKTGHIVVALKESTRSGDAQRWMELSVEDTGIGIAPDKTEVIFEPFTQADSSMSRQYGGTGLGLSISRRLCEILGGRLEVTSTLGQGSRFFATLPLKAAKATPQPKPEAFPEATLSHMPRPLRVLIVEDDQTNLKLLVRMVCKLGYGQPLVARDGHEAVKIATRQPVDCIFMDVQMPGLDGIEATRSIRRSEAIKSTRPAFICALTANTVSEVQQACFDVGMNHFLNKPVKLTGLAGVLSQASEKLPALQHAA